LQKYGQSLAKRDIQEGIKNNSVDVEALTIWNNIHFYS